MASSTNSGLSRHFTLVSGPLESPIQERMSTLTRDLIEPTPVPRKYPEVRAPGIKKVLVDDEVTKVTYYRYEDGEGGGVHTHEYPHLVVMFNNGPSRSIENGQTLMLESERMNHVMVPAGKTHEVWNESGHTQYFLEIDFKDLPK